MKRNIIKSFRLFEEELNSGLTPEQEKLLDDCTKGTWSFDKSTGLVDVDGDFKWNNRGDFKGIRFGKVSGDFDCSYNTNLTSLDGAPQEVGGKFICNYTSIENLEGLPQKVASGVYLLKENELTSLKGLPDKAKAVDCSRNNLTSLEGAPREIEINFNAGSNNLKNLIGSPQKVGLWFSCSDQGKGGLTSLEGAPREVGGGFDCSKNNLTSLEGAPGEVGMNYKGIWRDLGVKDVNYFPSKERIGVISFNCSNNNLTSLKGSPQKVGGNFYCEKNPLTSLVGVSKEIGGEFYCDEFETERGEWNFEGWLNKFTEGNGKLISTIISPEYLNKEIQKDPSGMVVKLKGVLKNPAFKKIKDQLVIPDRLKPEADLLGDLGSLGF